MKAEQILRLAQGQIAGSLVRLHSLTGRIASLSHVADDVASGITPLEGFDSVNAQALSAALEVEVGELDKLAQQITSGYAWLVDLSSRLPSPQVAIDLSRDGGGVTATELSVGLRLA